MKKYILLTLLFLTTVVNGQSNFLFFFDDNDVTPPTAPVIYALSTPGDIGITSDINTDCARMILYRGTTPDTSAMSIIDSAFTTSITKTDSPLTYNTNYYYSAKGVDASGNRSYFSTVVFDTVRAVKFAGDYDGSTEYLSLSSGTSVFNLNGAEMVPKDSNSTFESADTTDWTGAGTHSADTSSTYKQAGSYAMEVTSGGVGDTSTNYISLAYTMFEPIVAGEKYTVEYWANAVGSLGSNLIPDSASTFSTYPGGGITYWSVNRVTASWSSPDSSLLFVWTGTTSSPRGISKTTILTSGKTYKLTFRAKSDSNRTYGFNYSGTTVAGDIYAQTNPNLTTSWQNYSSLFKAASTTLYVATHAPSSMTLDDSIYVDNIVLSEVTKPTYTAKIGSKSWTSDTISVIPGVFEKVVYNFQATTAEVNTPIKIYCSQADTGWIDNFSITQAKDAMLSAWIKPGTPMSTSLNTIVSSEISSGAYKTPGLQVYGNYAATIAAYTPYYTIGGDVAFDDFPSNQKVDTTAWNYLTMTVNRTSAYSKIYMNGVLKDSISIASLGKCLNTGIAIGRRYYIANRYWIGYIGEVQQVNFDDLATETTWTPANLYYRTHKNAQGLNFPTNYTGGTVVFWNEWTGANITAILTSKDSYNHVMTGTNMIQSDFVEVDY